MSSCSGINKPVAVQDWMSKTNPQEDYILILDADMIMLKPFDPVKMGVAPGEDCPTEICSISQLPKAYPPSSSKGNGGYESMWWKIAGWAVSAFYGYLQGVSNDLALKHVPHVLPRNDTLAGPLGRRGDQVCNFLLPIPVILAVLICLPVTELTALCNVHRLEASQ